MVNALGVVYGAFSADVLWKLPAYQNKTKIKCNGSENVSWKICQNISWNIVGYFWRKLYEIFVVCACLKSYKNLIGNVKGLEKGFNETFGKNFLDTF